MESCGPILWAWGSGNGYFTNYRKVVILRDNMGTVIILNREEIGGIDCVANVYIGNK